MFSTLSLLVVAVVDMETAVVAVQVGIGHQSQENLQAAVLLPQLH
jgi:hypothetical protein